MTLAIEAVGLVKRFGKTLAVDGVDLAVRPGMVLGLLGPNGAGKTTVVRMLATLLRPDAGRARVCGADIVQQADRVRELIGLTGQYAAVDEDLTGFENLLLIGRLLEVPRVEAKRRSAELLERFDLADAAGRSVKTYSGGMRRRLDLAASLVHRPAVLSPRVCGAAALRRGAGQPVGDNRDSHEQQPDQRSGHACAGREEVTNARRNHPGDSCSTAAGRGGWRGPASTTWPWSRTMIWSA
jgi:ABC-type transport system involved in cytochrome c biogenesis ATPase subunit